MKIQPQAVNVLPFFEVEELEQRLENKWSDKECIDEVFDDGNCDCMNDQHKF